MSDAGVAMGDGEGEVSTVMFSRRKEGRNKECRNQSQENNFTRGATRVASRSKKYYSRVCIASIRARILLQYYSRMHTWCVVLLQEYAYMLYACYLCKLL